MLDAGSIAVIIPAAGKSRRFGGEDKKIFAPLAGHPVWWHSVARLRSMNEVDRIVIAIDADDRPRWEGEFAPQVSQLGVQLVDGGNERYESVLNALQQTAGASFVAVHDAARPLVTQEDLQKLFAAASEHDAVMLACPVSGTIKKADADGNVIHTVDRSDLWEAQTPQMFRRETLENAYTRWQGWPITDDASLIERSGGQVCLVQGASHNLKITTAADLQIAEAILAMRDA